MEIKTFISKYKPCGVMEHTELPPMHEWIMRRRLSDRFYRLIATNNGETK